MPDLRATNNRVGAEANMIARRAAHVPKACDECKRRKIRCTGATPCRRCGRLSLECRYRPNRNTRKNQNPSESDKICRISDQLAALQAKVESLAATRSENDNSSPASVLMRASSSPAIASPASGTLKRKLNDLYRTPEQDEPYSEQQIFVGPTSSAFGLGVAKSSLQTIDKVDRPSRADGLALGQSTASGRGTEPVNFQFIPQGASSDPLLEMTPEESKRLLDIYEEDIQYIYPLADIKAVRLIATAVHTHIQIRKEMDVAVCRGFGDIGLDADDINILKMVLANALIVDGCGKSDLGVRLYKSVQARVNSYASALNIGLTALTLILLVAQYFFFQDQELLAWRTIGFAARVAQELGLHQTSSLDNRFPEKESHREAIRLFWSIYVLDRRWSFGTGLPFSLRDSDIDDNLPKPDETVPFLHAMVDYSRILGSAWDSICHLAMRAGSHTVDGFQHALFRQTTDSLYSQLVEWNLSLPDALKFDMPQMASYLGNNATTSRQVRCLHTMLFLRTNDLRLLLYRHIFLTPSTLQANLSTAGFVTAIAKDMISVLLDLYRTSDLYIKLQCCFNHFLASALAVLFLAVAHAPNHFSNSDGDCAHGIMLAKDLVLELEQTSRIDRRLYRTVKNLNRLVNRLGLLRRVPKTGLGNGNQTESYRKPAAQQLSVPDSYDFESMASLDLDFDLGSLLADISEVAPSSIERPSTEGLDIAQLATNSLVQLPSYEEVSDIQGRGHDISFNEVLGVDEELVGIAKALF